MDRYDDAVSLFDEIWTIKIEMGMIDLLSINYSRLGQIAKRRLR